MPGAGLLDISAILDYFAIQSEVCVQNLEKALGDITSIRRQVARSTEFRGYGPVTLAATGVLAMAAAAAQARWIPDPAAHFSAYLATWASTALLSMALIGTQMYTRSQRIHSGMADAMIRMAVEQFLPSVGAGALLTLVLVARGPGSLWILPGLWQVIFSLGIFASCRFLPKAMLAAGLWYLICGLASVALGDARAFSPWVMGISYGVGQLLVAAILLFTRKDASDGL
jgi:hypothetical protein